MITHTNTHTHTHRAEKFPLISNKKYHSVIHIGLMDVDRRPLSLFLSFLSFPGQTFIPLDPTIQILTCLEIITVGNGDNLQEGD